MSLVFTRKLAFGLGLVVLACSFETGALDEPSVHDTREKRLAQIPTPAFEFDTEQPFGDPELTSCSATSISDPALHYPASIQVPAPGGGDPGTGEQSISFWFFAHNLDHPVHSLVAKGNAVSTHSGWRFFVQNGELVFRVGARNPQTGIRYSAATAKKVSPGRWYHVVGVIDRQLAGEADDREEVRLYLDDEFEPQPSGGAGAASRFLEMPGAAAVTSPQPLRIGWTRNPDNEQHTCSNGIVTGLKLYSRALATGEISDLQQDPEFEGRTKETIANSFPSGVRYTFSSENEFGTPGLATCNAATVGDLGYPATVQIDDPMSGNQSVSFWFYARDFDHAVHSLVSKGNAVSSHTGWRFFVENGKLVFRVGLLDRATGQRYAAGTSVAVKAGRWYHVVGTLVRQYPGTPQMGRVMVYLDGQLSTTSGGGGAPSQIISSEVPALAEVSSPQPLRVGWARNPDNEQHTCSNGKITGLRVYPRALNTSEIAQLGQAEPSMKSDQLLFDPATDEFNIPYHTFRIPSLVATTAGSLLAFAEGRACGTKDYGNINLVYKRSTNGGKSWSALREVVGKGPDTWGNPTAVVDEDTGRIWLFLNWTASDKEQASGGVNPCTGQPTSVIGVGDRPVYVTWSDDDGQTWAEPLKQNTTTRNFQPPGTGFDAVGPGVGIQVRGGEHPGRLIVPAIGRNIYSDDHGATWTYSEYEGRVSETTIVELSDGSLLLNDKMVGDVWNTGKRRWVSRGTIEGGFAEFAPHAYLLDPRAQGSTLLYSRSPERILFLNSNHTVPFAANRCKMRVRISYDDGVDWPVSRMIHEPLSAQDTCDLDLGGYSSLAAVDEWIGALVERGDPEDFYAIEFHRFNLPWLVSEPPQ